MNGYVLLDLTMLDSVWGSGDTVTVPGLYARSAEVINSGCLVLLKIPGGAVVPAYPTLTASRASFYIRTSENVEVVVTSSDVAGPNFE